MSKVTDHGDALCYIQDLIDRQYLSLDDYKKLLYDQYKVKSITALQIGQLKPFLDSVKIFMLHNKYQ